MRTKTRLIIETELSKYSAKNLLWIGIIGADSIAEHPKFKQIVGDAANPWDICVATKSILKDEFINSYHVLAKRMRCPKLEELIVADTASLYIDNYLGLPPVELRERDWESDCRAEIKLVFMTPPKCSPAKYRDKVRKVSK